VKTPQPRKGRHKDSFRQHTRQTGGPGWGPNKMELSLGLPSLESWGSVSGKSVSSRLSWARRGVFTQCLLGFRGRGEVSSHGAGPFQGPEFVLSRFRQQALQTGGTALSSISLNQALLIDNLEFIA
jgi:hypothetical protein